jgi:hypothetical protein
VVETAAGTPDDEWNVAEFRLYDRGQEVHRAKEWRIRANANPWDVQLAFDNNPVTRWRSHEGVFVGMAIELDTGKPLLVDAVVLECARDQNSTRLRLESGGPEGQWTTVVGAPASSDHALSGNLRAAAMRELKARGITHLLSNAGDDTAADFQRNANAWGIKFLGRAGNDWLYALD